MTEKKIDNIHFTLNLQDKSTLEECVKNAKATIERLEKYIANGHSCEGLDFTYEQIEKL